MSSFIQVNALKPLFTGQNLQLSRNGQFLLTECENSIKQYNYENLKITNVFDEIKYTITSFCLDYKNNELWFNHCVLKFRSM
ncbi:hypothetical protein A3Q56_06687 [Intoshia linei]|uniref:Uncharacterized protein n=1 Tax=Intoshia linei TaxID=1819745 RepID=A0A177AVR4_9BILA|nr:hypothetical protein A3Q56_06687 [Intoshia linei]